MLNLKRQLKLLDGSAVTITFLFGSLRNPALALRLAPNSGMSGKFLLQLLSIGLLCFVLNGQGQKVTHYSHPGGRASKQDAARSMYKAMVTGDKGGVPKDKIQNLKHFGLMHLLTPSGLHLGSFLIAFKLFPRLRIILVASMFIGSFFLPGFLALKRMLVFYLLNHKIRDVKMSFLATLLVCLITGNYQESPISFCFSVIFWGSIVFHKGGKLSLTMNLFGLQALISLLMNQEINILAALVNPIMTGVFTVLFPALLFFYPLNATRWIGLEAMELFLKTMDFLGELDTLLCGGFTAFFIYLLFTCKKRKLLACSLLFLTAGIAQSPSMKRRASTSHSPLPEIHEHTGSKGRAALFLDRKCVWKTSAEVDCRPTLSNYSRPSL